MEPTENQRRIINALRHNAGLGGAALCCDEMAIRILDEFTRPSSAVPLGIAAIRREVKKLIAAGLLMALPKVWKEPGRGAYFYAENNSRRQQWN